MTLQIYHPQKKILSLNTQVNKKNEFWNRELMKLAIYETIGQDKHKNQIKQTVIATRTRFLYIQKAIKTEERKWNEKET